MDKSTDATTKTSASANNGSDAATNMANNDAISTNALQSPTMHENNNKTNNLGCGTSASAETAATPIHHSNYNNNIKNNHIKEISPNKNNNNGNKSSGGSSISSSILTTAMAAANGLPLQQRPQQQPLINLQINTTTGGNFGVTVDAQITVETLKKLISKKLKVAKDRICLLHREKELHDGTLNENNLMDGSKIILIPNVETGLLAQRPENTVMQALESLNDSQVNDFLSGKTPLNLSMRLGDHMMLIQLQLSTVNPIAQGLPGLGGASTSHHHHHHHGCSMGRRSSLRATTQRLLSANNQEQQKLAQQQQKQQQQQQQQPQIQFQQAQQLKNHNPPHHYHQQQQQQQQHPHQLNGQSTVPVRKSEFVNASMERIESESETRLKHVDNNKDSEVKIATRSATKRAGSPIAGPFKKSDLSEFFNKQNVESLQSIVKSFNTRVKEATTTIAAAAAAAAAAATTATVEAATKTNNNNNGSELEQSPIKSLSNLVSSPIKTMPIKHIPQISSSSAGVVTTTKPQQHAQSTYGGASKGQMTTCQDPIAAQLTSCLCTRLNVARNIINNTINNKMMNADVNKQYINNNNNTTTNNNPKLMSTITNNNKSSILVNSSSNNNNNSTLKQCLESNTCRLRPSSSTGVLMLTSSTPKVVISPNRNATGTGSEQLTADCLHKTANNPIVRNKHHRHHHQHYHHNNFQSLSSSALGAGRPKQIMRTSAAAALATTSTSSSSNSTANASALISDVSTRTTSTAAATATPATNTSTAQTNIDDTSLTAVTDTRTLAEASRNLTQTLRKLSKEVFTNKIDLSAVTSDEIAPRKTGSGAVIESMKNHGKGIYSGTFSGTLNPALQDRYGRPKRDISTVIHILNDLLSATPQYSRGARISVESPSTSAAAALNEVANGSHQNNKSKQITIKPYHPCLKCLRHSQHFSSSVCNTGECNKNTTLHAKAHGGTSLSCCIDTTCSQINSGLQDGHAYRDRHVCTCRYRIVGETGEREREEMCQKCLVDMENTKTKAKLDQLRLVMQQRKEKREARKQKGAPYLPRPFSPTAAISSTSLSSNGLPIALKNSTATSVKSIAAESVPLTPTKATLAASTPLGGTTTTTTTSATAAAATATTNNSSSSANTSEVPPNHIVEEVDTAA